MVTNSNNVTLSEFGLDYSGNEVESNDPILQKIKAIDPSISSLERSHSLDVVIELLAEMLSHRRDGYLKAIAEHFNMKKVDLAPIEKAVNERAKALTGGDKGKKGDKPNLVASGGNIVDLAEENGEVVFLLLVDGRLESSKQVCIDGINYSPPLKKSIPCELIDANQVIGQYSADIKRPTAEVDRELFDDLVTTLEGVAELPSKPWYGFLAAWILHTYRIERAQYSPIICMYAVPERGKSRTGKALIYMAYRGVHLETMREAHIIRLAEHWKATLFIDVIDPWRKAQTNGAEDIILGRFEKGVQVFRVLYPEKGPFDDTEQFRVFGPTIIGTNEPLGRILETRAIQISMPMSNKVFDDEVTPERFTPLKLRLTSYRARHLRVNETDVTDVTDVSKPARGRLGDILKPILEIYREIVPEREPEFMELVAEIEQGRLNEKSESLEGRILLAINNISQQVSNGLLGVKEITDKLNWGKSGRELISYQRVGRVLLSLGFQKGKKPDGSSAILYDPKKVASLSVAYGLNKTSVTSVTSEPTAPDDPNPGTGEDLTDFGEGLF